VSASRVATVRSADGTTIGYREYGAGPGLILVHGGMLAGQDLSGMAEALADRFHVFVPDRRGRGMSGPYGPEHGLGREVEDLQALVAAIGAESIFGLSVGGLIALRTALLTPAVRRIALYEPPLSVDGSVPVGWLPRFDREVTAGKLSAATVTALKETRLEPTFGRFPRWLLTPVGAVLIRLQRAKPGEASMAELIPTMSIDTRTALEMADTAAEYASLPIPVLLLGGTKSPAYIDLALETLAAVLPDARRVTLPGLDHSAPTNHGDPLAVARALSELSAPAASDGGTAPPPG
jgi:pimeloyl-ACP methyl ester carboxylesterase